jgi:DNA ligase (NAD+)
MPSEGKMKDIENQITTLRRKIEMANDAYYIYHDPIMPDYEYDMLVRELRALEDAYPEYVSDSSPTEKVNEDITEDAIKVKHPTRMYSLDNIYNTDELEEYFEFLRKNGIDPSTVRMVANEKLDGAALEVIYTRVATTPVNIDLFELNQVVTRGNGEYGEDVTQYVKDLLDVPEFIGNYPRGTYDTIVVRGEAVVDIETFEKINQDLSNLGYQTMASPRHMASAYLRTKNHKIEIAEKCIRFVAYGMDDMSMGNRYGITSYDDLWETVVKMGFDFVFSMSVTGIEELKNFYLQMEKIRHSPDRAYSIDGVVFRLDSYELQDKLGFTHKAPRFARAIKFPPERGTSVVTDIIVQVGRTGILTPVVEVYPPIRLGGVSITRATLHNQDVIDKLDLRIGDTITIERSGDVIPKVVSVDHSKRPNDSVPFKLPSTCPMCGEPTVRPEGKVGVFCGNPTLCPAGRGWYLTFVASRAGLDLQGFGEVLVHELYKRGRLTDLTSFFDLTVADLEDVGVRKGRAEKLLTTIRRRMGGAKLPDIIRVLAIPGVGATTAKLLAEHFGSLEKLQNATIDELITVPSVGEITADGIVTYFKAHEWASKLSGYGLDLEYTSPVSVTTDSPLSGKRVRITGSLEEPRSTVMEKLVKLGAIPTSSITKLDILIVGENPSAQTLESAEARGVKIILGKDLQPYMT